MRSIGAGAYDKARRDLANCALAEAAAPARGIERRLPARRVQHAAGERRAQHELIEALAQRYVFPPPADRSALDRAFAAALAGVWQRHPDDPDVGALYALAQT